MVFKYFHIICIGKIIAMNVSTSVLLHFIYLLLCFYEIYLLLFYFVSMMVLSAHLNAHHMCSCCPGRSEKGIGSTGTGVADFVTCFVMTGNRIGVLYESGSICTISKGKSKRNCLDLWLIKDTCVKCIPLPSLQSKKPGWGPERRQPHPDAHPPSRLKFC